MWYRISFIPWMKYRVWAPSFTSPWLAPQLPPKLKRSPKKASNMTTWDQGSRSTVVSFFSSPHVSLYRQSDPVNVHIDIGLFVSVVVGVWGLRFWVLGWRQAEFVVWFLGNAEGMQHFGIGGFVLGVEYFHGFGIWVVVCFSLRKFGIYSSHGAPSMIIWDSLSTFPSSSQVPRQFPSQWVSFAFILHHFFKKMCMYG